MDYVGSNVKDGFVVQDLEEAHGQKVHALTVAHLREFDGKGFEDVEEGVSQYLLGLEGKGPWDIQVDVVDIVGILEKYLRVSQRVFADHILNLDDFRPYFDPDALGYAFPGPPHKQFLIAVKSSFHHFPPFHHACVDPLLILGRHHHYRRKGYKKPKILFGSFAR